MTADQPPTADVNTVINAHERSGYRLTVGEMLMWVLPTPASLNRVTQSVRHVLRRHRRSRQTMADECRPGRPASRRRRLTGGRAAQDTRETATRSERLAQSVQAG